ncbi:MAG: ABC transporter ATP-binding protein [Luteibaculum sp.]
MEIKCQGIIKSYNFQKIWGPLSFSFQGPGKYSILGGNGSGKSTLVRCLSGLESPKPGNISWKINGEIPREKIHEYCALSSPAMQLYEEFSVSEMFQFLAKFKSFAIEGEKEFIQLLGLPKRHLEGKRIDQFSSGMKQRVKLLLALSQTAPFVFLDEPTSNLDSKAIDWYYQLVDRFCQNNLLIVATNQASVEAPFCQPGISLQAEIA